MRHGRWRRLAAAELRVILAVEDAALGMPAKRAVELRGRSAESLHLARRCSSWRTACRSPSTLRGSGCWTPPTCRRCARRS